MMKSIGGQSLRVLILQFPDLPFFTELEYKKILIRGSMLFDRH